MEFPAEVRDDIGAALGAAQFGRKDEQAKPWKGEGPGVFEIVDDFRGDTYRAVYTVRLADAVYVLHAFQKKSPSRIRTAQADVRLVSQPLKLARRHYEEKHGAQSK